MLGKAGDVNAKSVTRAVCGQAVRLVGTGEYEGFACERRGPIEGLAVERMASPAIGPVNLVEQKLVFEVGAQHFRRRHTDVDLVAKERGRDRIPGRDVDQDLNLRMPGMKSGDRGIEALANEARNDLDRNAPLDLLGEIAEPFRNVADERVERPAGFGDKHAFIGQLEAARAAAAQSDAELGLEAFERQTERGLLAPERPAGTAHAAGFGDLVKRLEEIPINLAREIDGGWKHDGTPLLMRLAACMGNSTPTWRALQNHSSGCRRARGGRA